MITHIQAILNTYLHASEASRTVDGSHPVVGSLKQLSAELGETDFIHNNGHLQVKAGWGAGNWTKVPWVAIFDKRVTQSAQQGIYPVFLFKADMTGFYLSLSAATGVPYGAPTQKRSAALAAESSRLGIHFQALSSRGFGHLPTLSLAVNQGPGVGYEAGSVVHKYYANDALPEEPELYEDLDALMQAYELAITNGVIGKDAADSENKTLCWIFQGNVDQFGVDEYLRTRDEIRWSVRQNRADVHTGDRVLIWRSGEDGGVVAVCVVLSEPDPLLSDDSPELWYVKQSQAEVRCRLKVLDHFTENPIRRATIKGVLPELNIIKASRGTNFQITEADYETILALRQMPEFSFAELLRHYHDENIIFCSSAHKRRYAIASYDDTGVIVERIDADEPQKVTFAHADKLLRRVQEAGDIDFMTLDNTSAVRNTVLQAKPLALTADQTTITFFPDNSSCLHNFLQVLEALRQVDALDKSVMLLCVLDGIDDKELTANRITFDWIASRFIARMKLLGKTVTEQRAAQPFYHLIDDLFWLHAVQHVKESMQDGRAGSAGALKNIKYALIKDTYWLLLQDPGARAAVRKKLETLTISKTSPSQLLLHAKAAFKATGFFHEAELLVRIFVAIASKPFLILTGNSGTGKTKLAELFAQWLTGNEKHRFAIVPVGADWTDNRNVLGFVNHLRSTQVAGEGADVPMFQSTKILDLLLAAQAQPSFPFLLILDEMNLSHVERYFADFLSTMESKDGIILLHRENRNLPRKPGGPADVPAELPLPRNVFVIGTVNVDETTYMFSPKVLDRANVLEFLVSSVASTEFLQSGGRPVGEIAAAPFEYAEAFLELSYRARGLNGATPLGLVADPANPPAEAIESLRNCQQTLADLFALMQQRHQEFAFRSMAEMLRFLAVDYEITSDKVNWNYQAAMDAQILQKLLPKLHGSKRKIGSLLAALAKYCEKGDRLEAEKPLTNDTTADAYPVTGDKAFKDPVFKGSHRKLCEMIDSLRRDQFVSFVQ